MSPPNHIEPTGNWIQDHGTCEPTVLDESKGMDEDITFDKIAPILNAAPGKGAVGLG